MKISIDFWLLILNKLLIRTYLDTIKSKSINILYLIRYSLSQPSFNIMKHNHEAYE